MFRSLFSIVEASRKEQNSPEESNHTPSADEAQRVIDDSLREMDNVIERLNAAKNRAAAERDESTVMLQSYKSALADLQSRAKSLIQSGHSAEARDVLAEQQSLETVIASFERITGNLSASVQKLVTQLDSMRIQREELKAQRSVLASQLVSARSHEEFIENIKISGASHEFLERETIHAELRSSVQNASAQPGMDVPDYHQDFSTLAADTALKALEDRIESEIATERAEKERLRNEASLKRFYTAFAVVEKNKGVTAPKASFNETSQPSTPVFPDKHKQMEDFFANTANAASQQVSEKKLGNIAPENSGDGKSKTKEDHIRNFFFHNP